MTYAWFNGGFLPKGEVPRITVLDRGYLLGDSVFETIRFRHYIASFVEPHLELLHQGAGALEIPLPYSRGELLDVLCELVERVGSCDVTARITLSRGEGGHGVSPRGCSSPTMSILARPTIPYDPEYYRVGIDSTFVTTRRIPADCIDPRFKTGCYLPAVLAKLELDRLGLVEGVMCSVGGNVSSGSVSNVFFVIDGTLVTPDLDSDCREGVTRARILAFATQLGIPVRARRITRAETERASEMFFTNTLMDCLPVRSLCSRRLDVRGPVHAELSQAFAPTGRSA